MKPSYSLRLAAASLSAALLAGCEPGSRWIGLVVGDPTGLGYRQDVARDDGISLALDLQLIDDVVVHAHLDWLRYEPGWRSGNISFYWGLGVDFASWTGNAPGFADAVDTTYVAVGVPLGLEVDLAVSPSVLLYVQITPEVSFEEERDFHVDGQLGILFGF